MYLELSRPDGDVSRWEKVLKRLTLLNKHYPMKGLNCRVEDIQRLFQYGNKNLMTGGKKIMDDYRDEDDLLMNIEERIFHTVRDVLMGQMLTRLHSLEAEKSKLEKKTQMNITRVGGGNHETIEKGNKSCQSRKRKSRRTNVFNVHRKCKASIKENQWKRPK